MKGIFGSMFDLNHDGNISPLENAMELVCLQGQQKKQKKAMMNKEKILQKQGCS